MIDLVIFFAFWIGGAMVAYEWSLQ